MTKADHEASYRRRMIHQALKGELSHDELMRALWIYHEGHQPGEAFSIYDFVDKIHSAVPLNQPKRTLRWLLTKTAVKQEDELDQDPWQAMQSYRTAVISGKPAGETPSPRLSPGQEKAAPVEPPAAIRTVKAPPPPPVQATTPPHAASSAQKATGERKTELALNQTLLTVSELASSRTKTKTKTTLERIQPTLELQHVNIDDETFPLLDMPITEDDMVAIDEGAPQASSGIVEHKTHERDKKSTPDVPSPKRGINPFRSGKKSKPRSPADSATVVFNFLINNIVNELNAHGSRYIVKLVEFLLHNAAVMDLDADGTKEVRDWCQGRSIVMHFTAAERGQMQSLLHNVYQWLGDMFSPAEADRIFTDVFSRAMNLPQAKDFPADELL